MVKRLWFVVASLGLVLSAAVLLWRVDGAEAQQTRRSYFPLITRSARVASSVTTLQVGVAGALQPNGNVLYTVRITNTAAVGVSVLPLDFSYNSNYLQFLSAQYTPDITGAGASTFGHLPGIGIGLPWWHAIITFIRCASSIGIRRALGIFVVEHTMRMDAHW